MSESEPLASMSSEGSPAPKRCRGDDDDVPTRPLPMNLWRLARVIDTDDNAIKLSQSHGLLPTYTLCPSCYCRLEPYHKVARKGSYYYRFQCRKGPCRKASSPHEVSLKKGTWFECSRISIQKSLVLAYCFAANFSHSETIIQSSLTDVTSSGTVVDYFNNCREVCVEVLLRGTGGNGKQIGGPNCTVEIEEAMFGKRKLNRGHHEEGQWVLGGICQETKECFLTTVENRTEQTLVDLVKSHVQVGSVILTDDYPSHNQLIEEGYNLIVNHPEDCSNPQTGAGKKLIESTWLGYRRGLPGDKSIVGHLAEYIWRRSNRGEDPFFALLRDIGKVYPAVFE